jgi:O-methyltransferase
MSITTVVRGLQSGKDRARLVLNRMRLGLAETILPARYYVQELSHACWRGNAFPGFAEAIREFNYRPDKLPREGVRWFMINLLLGEVRQRSSGDYAELGTYRGKTARIIYRGMAEGATLHCFDTFEGFPEKDVDAEAGHSAVAVATGLYGNTGMESVKRYILDGATDERLVLTKGRFPETFTGLERQTWRFVHLDCDLAEPMKAGLELFWPGLVPGGMVLVHDFNGYYAEGLQKVVREFCGQHGTVPVPMCDSAGSAVLVKGWG